MLNTSYLLCSHATQSETKPETLLHRLPLAKQPLITTSHFLLQYQPYYPHIFFLCSRSPISPHLQSAAVLLTTTIMSAFHGSLRGGGLTKVQYTLHGVETERLRLDDETLRFSCSPPSIRTYPSGIMARTTPLTQQQRCNEERRWQLINERRASLPYYQLTAQENEEKERLWAADPEASGIRPIPIGGSFGKMVYEKIRKSWVDQGIWNDKWNDTALGLWKHEEPLELEPESETDSEADPPFSFSSSRKFCQQSQAKSRRPKRDNERRRIAERRIVRERDREASRPYHQFVFQISKERERIGHESRDAEGSSVADINTRAYENVKNTWTKRGIWYMQWGILPGMSWMHEVPLEQLLNDDLISETQPGNATLPRNEAGTAPPRRIFGSSSPVGSLYFEKVEVIHGSKQGSSANNDPSSVGIGDANNTRTSPNAHHASNAVQGPRRVTFMDTIQAHHQTPEDDMAVAGEASSPSDPVKVATIAGEKQSKPQSQPHTLKKVFAHVHLFSSITDGAERQSSPVHTSPRRSERSRRSVSSETKDLIRTPATGTSKRTVRPKPERDVSGANVGKFAKPQGIVKRQQAKTTRGKFAND